MGIGQRGSPPEKTNPPVRKPGGHFVTEQELSSPYAAHFTIQAHFRQSPCAWRLHTSCSRPAFLRLRSGQASRAARSGRGRGRRAAQMCAITGHVPGDCTQVGLTTGTRRFRQFAFLRASASPRLDANNHKQRKEQGIALRLCEWSAVQDKGLVAPASFAAP